MSSAPRRFRPSEPLTALKIVSKCVDGTEQCALYVDILDQVLVYYESELDSVTPKYVNGLVQLIETNMAGLDGTDVSVRDLALGFELALGPMSMRKLIDAGLGVSMYGVTKIAAPMRQRLSNTGVKAGGPNRP